MGEDLQYPIFTFEKIRKHFAVAKEMNYQVLTCKDYVTQKAENRLGTRVLVNRVDIDESCKKARRLCEIFNALQMKASFFVRLHAHEYNPFAFENYRALKFIRDSGHEIGYHSEVIDQATIWNEDAETCLRRDIKVLSAMLQCEVVGVASHGGKTGLNNLDFWKNRKASDFGLLYEAYDKSPVFNLFDDSRYVSDSSWTYWKSYDKGQLRDGDRRDLGDHLREGLPLVYSLIHPETYFDEHFYE